MRVQRVGVSAPTRTWPAAVSAGRFGRRSRHRVYGVVAERVKTKVFP